MPKDQNRLSAQASATSAWTKLTCGRLSRALGKPTNRPTLGEITNLIEELITERDALLDAVPDLEALDATPGTPYVNGCNLGPAERDPRTGAVESGPHVTRRAARAGAIAIVCVDQSPLNAKRWLLTLACGHGLYVTASRKPTRKTTKCHQCAREK